MKPYNLPRVVVAMIILFLLVVAISIYIGTYSAKANPTGKMDYVQVVCSSCSYPGLPGEAHVIFFDSRTGELWAYSDRAMVGKDDPVFIGKMTELGKRIVTKK